MYDTILIPTDGTDSVQPAIEHALNLAETYDATLHTLYVVDERSYAMMDVRTDLIIEALETEGQNAIETIRERAESVGLSVETTVETGNPYRSILEYAEKNDIDLIVMGTHGRRGLDRYLLGSVTEKVIRSSDVPVLTVRAPAAESD